MKILLIICTLFSLCLSSELCNPQDKKTLLRIKQHFGNPYFLASWTSDADCCKDWYSVDCDPLTHRITSLYLIGGDISGQIPPEIGDLVYLQSLTFHKLSNITGPVQPTISKLKSLTFLQLHRLNLTGSVPDFVSQLKNLTFLDFSFNGLSGSIPSSLSLLPNLEALHLDRNNLTGTIPESFGAIQGKVTYLYLSHNQLSGIIPVSLGNRDFYVLDLSRNKLEGDASMLFGLSKTTWIIDLSRNVLEFDFSKVVFPSSLAHLDVNHNKIYGSIPQQMAQLDWQFLNVSYNRLCGQIPGGPKLQRFDNFSFFHNRCLCGHPLASCK